MAIDDLFDPFAEERKTEDQVNAFDESLKAIMRTPEGRSFIWGMLERTGVYRTTFRTSSEMAFLEGCRSVGVFLTTKCHEVAFEETLQMMKEAKENDRSEHGDE